MELLRTFILRVEPFGGSDIDTVADELCQLAGRIGVRCEAPFNGVTLWARPGDEWPRLVDAYNDEVAKPFRTHKIAQCLRPLTTHPER